MRIKLKEKSKKLTKPELMQKKKIIKLNQKIFNSKLKWNMKKN